MVEVQCLKCLTWFDSLRICPKCNEIKDGKYVIKSLKTGKTYLRVEGQNFDWTFQNEGETTFNSDHAAHAAIRKFKLDQVEVIQRI